MRLETGAPDSAARETSGAAAPVTAPEALPSFSSPADLSSQVPALGPVLDSLPPATQSALTGYINSNPKDFAVALENPDKLPNFVSMALEKKGIPSFEARKFSRMVDLKAPLRLKVPLRRRIVKKRWWKKWRHKPEMCPLPREIIKK